MPTDASATPLHHDTEIDTSGLQCPLPILRAKKALNAMESGQVLRASFSRRGLAGESAAH